MFLAVDGLRDCTKVEDGTDIFLNYEIGESPKIKIKMREKKKQVPLCVYLLLQAPLHHWTWSIDRVSLPVKRESFCCWSQLRTPAPVCHSFSITQLASAH